MTPRIRRRDLLQRVPLLAATTYSAGQNFSSTGGQQPGRTPNVVLLISDQQRADTMPGARRLPLRTPHLDWLADRGTVFERAYCTSPMCSPSRASILSGLYPHTTGMVSNHQMRPVTQDLHLSPDVKLIADRMRPQGYACGYSGKWHLGTGSDRRGFRDVLTRSGDHDVDGPQDNDILRFTKRAGIEIKGKQNGYDPDPAEYDARTQVGSSLLPLAFHTSTQDALAAASFIRQEAEAKRPFLLVYSCYEPHPPFVSPQPFSRSYDRSAMILPENRSDTHALELLRNRPDWQLQPAAPFSDDDLKSMWAAYCGAVSFVDHLLGLILAALIETGQFDDTLIIFTSDHGEMLGSHGLLFKGAVLFEETVRIPLLIKAPRQAGARRTRQIVSHVDLAPTILRWCGSRQASEMQGQDIRALVEGSDAAVHPGVALEYHSSNWGERPAPLRGWVTAQHKYVEGPSGAEELYDLSQDPLERNNLVSDPSSAPILAAMQEGLKGWRRNTGDRWPEIKRPQKEIPPPRAPQGKS